MATAAFLAVPCSPNASTSTFTVSTSTHTRVKCRRRARARTRARAPPMRRRAIGVSGSIASATFPDAGVYERYLIDVARVKVPVCLQGLLYVLQQAGDDLIPPSTAGLHPFLVPLSRNADGAVTGLLRWPTAPQNMELPVVRSVPGSLALMYRSPSAVAHISRAHATADDSGATEFAESIRRIAPAAELTPGCVARSGLPLERYVVVHVGHFPDSYEAFAAYHLAKGDVQSALVACERANTLFAGWASPHVYHARLLRRVERPLEARDAARFALQMPLWTMGADESPLQDMGRLAGYADDTSLRKIYQRLYEDPREEDVKGGKAPEQVALDRAAYFLDYHTANGVASWADVDLEPLADLYDQAQLNDIATFVRY